MIVALYFWRIPRSARAFALFSMARDRSVLRKSPGVSFAKMLGTGKGETFTPRDADLSRWGFLLCINENELPSFDRSEVVERWRAKSTQESRFLLDPLASRGQWSGHEPFPASLEKADGGQVAAITRARIKWHQNPRFWRAVTPVTASLLNSTGLISAIGIGEAPIGLQGTFSLWESTRAVREFAYQGDAHKQAIKATARHGWYSEELFARFAVREVRGEL